MEASVKRAHPPGIHLWLQYRPGLLLLAVLCAGSVLTPILRADPPVISGLSPRGAQRGRKVVLAIEGSNLAANPELVLALPAPRKLVTGDPVPPAPNRVAFEFLVNETDAPGPYPLRIRTDEGLSNPVIFLVGLFPEAAEAEPNDRPEDARPIEHPITVNGSLGAADRDTFRFQARAGQRITFEVEARRIGSAVDPTLHLLSPNGRELALSDDARGLNVDARLDHTFGADGEYLVQVHDAMYLGQSPSFYRLKVGPIAYADGVFPMGGRRGSELLVTFEGGTLSQPVVDRIRLDIAPPQNMLPVGLPPALDTSGALPFGLRVGDLPEAIESARAKPEEAQPFPAPSTMNGRLDRPGEVDRYSLAVKPGEKWTLEIDAAALGSYLDGVLEVSAPGGGRIAFADDSGTSPDPRLEFTAPAGAQEVTVSVMDLHRRGGTGFAYRLTARESRPDFLLSLATTTLNVPLSGTEIIAVDLARRGYNGPVRLQLVDPPSGFTVRGGLVAAGQPKGYLTISAPPEGKPRAMELVVRGVGEGEVPPALAQGTVFLAADRGVPVSPLRAPAVAAALARPLPITLKAEEGPVRVPLGQARAVKFQVTRGEGGAGALKLQGIFAPPGITVAEGTAGEKAGEGTLTFTAAANAPLGEGEAAVRAIIQLGGKAVNIVTPIFQTAVVPPFAVELARPALEGPLGGSAEVEGQVRREPPFAGDIEIKVEGLPAGMTAPAVVVPGAQAAFKLVITAADPQKAGKVELKLAASTKLADPKNPTVYAAPAVPFAYTVKEASKAP